MSVLSTVVEGARALWTRPERFHARFPISARLEMAFWERPGLWCDESTLRRIVDDVRAVARAAPGERGLPDYGLLRGRREDLTGRTVIILHDRGSGSPVAFSTVSLFELPIQGRRESLLYFGLTYVVPEHRRRGLLFSLYAAPVLLLLFRRRARGFWIATSTIVPSVVGIVSDCFDDVYPHYAGRVPQTPMHVGLARAIMTEHRHSFGVGDEAGFDEKWHIITNAHTAGSDALMMSFEEAPRYRVERANEFCRELLDYPRGDAFLLIGRIGPASALRALAARLVRGRLPARGVE